MNWRAAALWLVVGVTIGTLGRAWLGGPSGQGSDSASMGQGEREILHWTAPMDPSYRRDAPGKSPMGMDLVPVYADTAGSESGPGISVAPEVVQNLGVHTAEVVRGDLPRTFDATGYVTYDQDRIAHVHPRVSGWIEHLAVHSEGEAVAAGDLLFEIYSRELVAAQEEFLNVLSQGNRRLIDAANARLRALGMPDREVKGLSQDRKVRERVRVYAPHDGVVTRLGARHGMYVTPANEVMMLVDLSEVWVRVEVFPRQADWVRAGDKARLTLPYLPGRQWQAVVDYVYPELDRETLTLPIRLRVKNPALELRPGMYARATIYGTPLADVVSVSRGAVIPGSVPRVIQALGEGRFLPREVELGLESEDRVEIRRGLEPGWQVVTSGQFLLDSEASLAGAMIRLGATAESTPAHDSMVEPTEAAKRIFTQATVREVDAASRRLVLSHEPIPDLGWPAMTMGFAVDDAVELSGLAVGDRVHVGLDKHQDVYHVSVVHRLGGPEQAP